MPAKVEAKVEAKEKESAAAKAGVLKDKNLQLAVAAIEKQFGAGSIMRLGDSTAHVKIDVIPTGAFALDLALGVGGVPRGRVVEMFGPESSGKTTLCLSIIASAQRAGGLAAFIDVEHAVDPSYAKKSASISMICSSANPMAARKR